MISETAFARLLLNLLEDCPDSVISTATAIAYSFGQAPQPSAETPPDTQEESEERPERTS